MSRKRKECKTGIEPGLPLFMKGALTSPARFSWRNHQLQRYCHSWRSFGSWYHLRRVPAQRPGCEVAKRLWIGYIDGASEKTYFRRPKLSWCSSGFPNSGSNHNVVQVGGLNSTILCMRSSCSTLKTENALPQAQLEGQECFTGPKHELIPIALPVQYNVCC